MLRGNVIIGQSGGPTAVINSSLAGAYYAAKKAGISRVYGMVNGVQGLIAQKYVDLDNILKEDTDIELLRRTPSSALGSCRYKLPDMSVDIQPYEKIFDVLKSLGVAYFVYIGGNDSMDTIAKLSAYAQSIKSDIKFVGVPKTVDNDLAATDHTPGFASAAKYIATVMKEIICDSSVYDMKSITVVEIMGRNAGWLAASSALSKDATCGGPDLIYLPEVSFDIEKCVDTVKNLLDKKNTVVIAVSEALRDKNGSYIAESGSVYASLDAFGHKIMSGTGQFLANYLGQKLNVKARGIELNTPQRCAAHIMSAQDAEDAFLMGEASVNAAIEGESGAIPVIIRTSDEPYNYKIEIEDINNIANIEKTIPKEWIINDGTYVSEEFLKYVRPLILGELEPVMENGLPKHFKIIR